MRAEARGAPATRGRARCSDAGCHAAYAASARDLSRTAAARPGPEAACHASKIQGDKVFTANTSTAEAQLCDKALHKHQQNIFEVGGDAQLNAPH